MPLVSVAPVGPLTNTWLGVAMKILGLDEAITDGS